MIFDNIKNVDRYKSLNEIYEALTVIKENRVETATLPEGMKIMTNKVVTESRDIKKFESHKDYADIHYCIKGQEKIEVNFKIEGLVTDGGYDVEKDLEFFEDTKEYTSIVLEEGDFLVVYPGQVHKPCCSVTDDKVLEKFVVKIKM